MPNSMTTYPLGPVTTTGTDLTVDILLDQPTRLNRFTADYLSVNRQRFLLDVIFDNGGGMTGGAIIYEKQALNDFYALRDIQQVAPGAAFPLVTFSRQEIALAEPKKWGGQYEVTDEARDRNDLRKLQRDQAQMGNTVIRKLNQVALAELETAIAALSGAGVIGGHNWTTAVPNGSNPTAPNLTPIADLAAVIEVNELRELGITYDTLIVNPQDMTTLRLFYGNALEQVLRDYGFDTLFVTAQVTAGIVYAVAGKGQVGQYRVESPLKTVSVREELLEKTTVKTSVRPAILVDNPYAVLKITGVRG